MPLMSNSQRISLVTAEVAQRTSRAALARMLECTESDLREWVTHNVPGLLPEFDALPATDRASDIVRSRFGHRQSRRAREVRAREREDRPRSSPDWRWDAIVSEMWTIRKDLGIGPGERIFPALPKAVQRELRPKVKMLVDMRSGYHTGSRLAPVDRVIRD